MSRYTIRRQRKQRRKEIAIELCFCLIGSFIFGLVLIGSYIEGGGF